MNWDLLIEILKVLIVVGGILMIVNVLPLLDVYKRIANIIGAIVLGLYAITILQRLL